MKVQYSIVAVLFSFSIAACADTALKIQHYAGYTDPCYDGVCCQVFNVTGTFSLPGVNGSGIVYSSAINVMDRSTQQQHVSYSYGVDMSNMSAPSSHCIRLVIHFGIPHVPCLAADVLVNTTSSGVADITSASAAPFGDLTFTFGSGCMSLGQASKGITMYSDQHPKTNVVTLIDDYVNPASGTTNEVRVDVTALIPDIPPNWLYRPDPLPYINFQGNLITTSSNGPAKTPANGTYDFTFQLFDDASNGLAIGNITTQQVQVVNGLFNAALPFDPATINWGNRWLDVAVRPTTNGGPFNGIGRLPLSPTPQALYAYSAGVVADISPSQAITSLNGFTGGVTIAAGPGIVITPNPSSDTFTTITISADQASDRNKKTDFAPVNAVDVLQRVATMPITTWRFTNEVAGIRHLGPMAQDFKGAFGLGESDTTIRSLDEGGVALAAIQALNQKLNEKDAEIQKLRQDNAAFQKKFEELKETVSKIAEKR